MTGEALTRTIIPHLWFDREAETAVRFYTAIFKDAAVGAVARYGDAGAAVSGQPKGSVMTVSFRLNGQDFVALNGGPHFKFTPAVSFMVNCESEDEVNALWSKLASEGSVLMPLEQYPFSPRFGWLQDRFGVSWQINLVGAPLRIAPAFLFVGERHGRAEEAVNFYVSLFEDAGVETLSRYGAGDPQPAGTLKFAAFRLRGQDFVAMDGAGEHPFTFTPAISFMVMCHTQDEIDRFWEKLSADAAAEQCGWLQDRFGVSWQIVPALLAEMMATDDSKRSERVMTAVLQMKKLDIAALKEAYEA